jgi:Flp pilus assembly protein CpaB
MRASTLFALTIAVLIALGVAVAARYSGFFDSQPPVTKKPEVYQVLVASQNLFKGITLSANDVKVVEIRDQKEIDDYKANRDKYMPAVPAAANYRILARNVVAGEPLMKDDFKEFDIAKPIHARLRPWMRAISVQVPKDRAAGGIIQVGERVDVMLTTQISCADGSCLNPSVESAIIARDVRVIAKRNSLWTILAPIPEDQPLQFTLEANPYRAALIEFARLKGDLTLIPTPLPAIVEIPPTPKAPPRPIFSDPDNREYEDEDRRVDEILANKLTVGDLDLERIFNLKPLPQKAAIPQTRIEQYSDVRPIGVSVFPGKGAPNGPKASEGSGTSVRAASLVSEASSGGYQFGIPGTLTASRSAKDCPTCNKNSPRR